MHKTMLNFTLSDAGNPNRYRSVRGIPNPERANKSRLGSNVSWVAWAICSFVHDGMVAEEVF